MPNDLIDPMIESVKAVLKTMAQTEVSVGQPHHKVFSRTPCEISGIIEMNGDQLSGNLLISFDTASILAIVSRMLMEDFESINNDVTDAVGELTNMICGSAKRMLAEQGIKFDMASPIVVVGKNVEVKQLSDSNTISVPFSTAEGSFVVESSINLQG